MSHYPPTLVRLIRQLSRLPGIGEKTAERLAMHILSAPGEEAVQLAESIRTAKQNVRMCSVCHGLSDSETCHICSNPSRDHATVCVVEQPSDMIALEKSGAYIGLYHVLQGVLSPMDGVGPENIRIKELEERLQRGDITEAVLATGTSVEGEATASYLAEMLKKYPVKITRIASGVPIGGDLKYIDALTLKRALDFRRLF